MTTLPILSRSGSSPPGEPSKLDSSSGGPVVVYGEFNAARPVPLPRTRALEDLIAAYEATPERAAMLAEARQALPAALYPAEQETLAILRLGAGFSQAQLAEQIGTSQSHIARIELGQNDPSTDLVARIAQALGVDEARAFAGVRAHRVRPE